MGWIKRFFCILQENDKTVKFLIIPLGLLIALLAGVGLFVMFCDSGTQVAGKWFGTLDTSDGKDDKQETLRFIGWLTGGLLASIGVIMIGRRADAQIENNKLSSENNQLTEKGHIEERFRAANEHLANERAGGRIAAFHQLYHLASKHEDFRKNIFDTLCSYLRVTTSDPEYQKNNKAKPSEEIQTLLDILFKPENKYNSEEEGKSAFRKLRADLQRSYLVGADLSRACLPQADFSDACLIGAYMENAKLHKCMFTRTKMHGAHLHKAKMQLATFQGTKLMGSDLYDADMRGSILKGGVDIRATCVSHLRMQGVVFYGTSFPEVAVAKEMEKSPPGLWHCVHMGGVYSRAIYPDHYEYYKFITLNRANATSEIRGIEFSGGKDRLKEDIDDTVKFLKKYINNDVAEDYQERLQEHTKEPPRSMTEEDCKNRIDISPYKEEDAKKWIDEYNEVMKPTPETENK